MKSYNILQLILSLKLISPFGNYLFSNFTLFLSWTNYAEYLSRFLRLFRKTLFEHTTIHIRPLNLKLLRWFLSIQFLFISFLISLKNHSVTRSKISRSMTDKWSMYTYILFNEIGTFDPYVSGWYLIAVMSNTFLSKLACAVNTTQMTGKSWRMYK